MSIFEEDIIDHMGVNDGEDACLYLAIIDPAGWEDTETHLAVLQDKINAYVGFIETKQYEEHFEGYEFESFIVEVYFLEDPPAICYEFLEAAERQLISLHITFKSIYSPM